MLKGHNICLRMLEKNDISILYAICNEENVKKYNITSNSMQNNNRRSDLRKALSIINEENILIGFMTYKKSNYCMNTYSIGITISSKYWGWKYGEDSIKTLLKYLFIELGAIKIELEVIKSNLRAINCYKKCGFIEEQVGGNKIFINGEYVDVIIMSIFRSNLTNI